MPRILRIVNRFNLGGPTYNAAYLSKYLPDDFQTLLVGGIHESHEESSCYILDDLGINYRQLESIQRSVQPSVDRKAYRELKDIIREFKPDIVHTHASKAGALGRMAAHKMKVPVVVHTFHGHVFHSYFGKLKTGFYKGLERYLAGRTDRIVAISQQQLKELSDIHRIAPVDKFSVIPLGFDLNRFLELKSNSESRFRTALALKPDDIAIGIIGRLAPIKNHSLFLRAFQELHRSNPNVKAIIVGDGETKDSIKAELDAMGLAYANGELKNNEPIVFAGWVKQIEEALEGLQIVALSSLNEGTPVSLIEAQAAGIPVVSTNVGGVVDVVPHEKSGFIVPDFEVGSFFQAMEKLVSNETLRNEMGSAGRQFVAERFHYKRLVHDHEELYRSLLR